MSRFVDFDTCPCGDAVQHRYLGLCSNCYKQKRKNDWKRNEEKRNLIPEYRMKKKKYQASHSKSKRVSKTCSCGNEAIKGSRYSFCRDCSNKHRKTNKIKYQNQRKKNHLPTKIRENIKSRLKQSFGLKSESIVGYLGCSIEDLKKHLESQFQEGMSWDNYGSWHIDHIVPLSTDYTDLSLHHYTNVQPLWKEDHFVKTAQENRSTLSKATKDST